MHDGVKLGRSLEQWCSFGKGEHMRFAALHICDGDEASGVTEVNKRRKRTVKSEDGVQKLVGTLTLQEPLKEIRNLQLFSSGYLPLISLYNATKILEYYYAYYLSNNSIIICLLVDSSLLMPGRSSLHNNFTFQI